MHLTHPRILHARRDMFLAQLVGGGRESKFDEVGVVVEVDDIHAQLATLNLSSGGALPLIFCIYVCWDLFIGGLFTL